MNDWQPIETAPKDGSRILLYWPKTTRIPIKIIIGNWRGDYWSNDLLYFDEEKRNCPTHWMPLPEPPQEYK